MRPALLLTFLSLASPTLAGDFRLQVPVDCEIGEDKRCYIQQYVDRDPGPGAADFTCSGLSYDGHKGTDFALRSLADMSAGVDVIAAAPGTVRGTRDAMPDRHFTPGIGDKLDGRDCGNGVVIFHEGGWETRYCHMKRGSIRVRRGDQVEAGDVLGQIGLSGRTQFPHLHLSVLKDDSPVDPFGSQSATCGDKALVETLWQDAPPYQPGGFISVGFSTGIPSYADIKEGTAAQSDLPDTAPALVLWAHMFGSRPGDVLRLTIQGADGTTVLQRDIVLEKAQAQLFRAVGRKTQDADWFLPGIYQGQVDLIRDGVTISDTAVELRVTSR